MKNPGWLITPLSLPFIVLGAFFLSQSDDTLFLIIGGGVLGIGALMFIGGFSRLVQGKDRKIMGQIIRPKAAARGSAVWALFCVFITPLVLGNTAVLNYINGPPFSIFILASGRNIILLGYAWLPFALIAFIVLWLFGFLFSGKIPKIVNIYNNFFITLCFTFWLNFGSQFFLWSFYSDKSDLSLLALWADKESIAELIVPIAIGGGVILLSVVLVLRSLKKLQESFMNLDTKGGKKVSMMIFLVLVYGLSLLPLYFGFKLCMFNVGILMLTYMNYIPLVFMAIVIFQAVSSLSGVAKNISSQRIAKGSASAESSFGIKTAVFFMILILAWIPIFLPLFDKGQNRKSNSIHNPLWNGWSNFKDALEADTEEGGYEIMSVQSSLSTIAQLDPDKQVILVIPGPNVFYNPAAEIPFLLNAFNSNFSMFICDDHGTTETLLIEMFISSVSVMGFEGATPLTFFPKGILYENGTFDNGDPMYYRQPSFPIISDFPNHDITTGINKVILGHSTAFLGGNMLNMLGWNFIGQTSGRYSYIDTNNDEMYDPLVDVYTLAGGVGDLLGGATSGSEELGIATAMLKGGFPLGGYEQAVFSVKDMGTRDTLDGNGTRSNRVFCATDATWLDNELTSVDGYDNLQMGLQAMDWLAFDRDHEDVIIVFDEAHLTPDTSMGDFAGRTELNSAASFGAVQGYVNWLSTNPLLGLVYPLFALQTLRKWIPKEGNKKKVQLKDLEAAEREKSILKFRTSSFFSQKINWYRQNKKYNQALLQLYRRLERKINRLLGNSGDRSIPAVLRAIRREKGKYLSREHYSRIKRFLDMMWDIKRNKQVIKEEREFETLFMEMSWVSDHI